MHFPSAPSAPRVARSRRDDHLQKGYLLPPKRATVGNVVSLEGDTCTVNILDEEIPYCIPLTTMPPVGAVVEIEARGDLMVILDWTYVGIDQVMGGDWYFTAAESPDWDEDYQAADDELDLQAGEHVWNTTPEQPGILWNGTALHVSPDDEFTFSATFDQLPDGSVVQVQLVVNWAAANAQPSPSNGEVVAYGATVTIDGDDVPISRTVTVPDTFDKPPNGKTLVVGAARIGLRFTLP